MNSASTAGRTAACLGRTEGKMKRMIRCIASLSLAFVLMLTMMPFLGQTVYASDNEVTIDGIKFELYDDKNDGSGIGEGSVWITGCSATISQIAFPATVTNKGVTFTATSSDFDIMPGSFKDNTNLTKIAIPNGYTSIGSNAFSGCTSLTEISIGSLKGYDLNSHFGIESGAFSGCTNLKTYNLDSTGMDNAVTSGSITMESLINQIKNSGIGYDSSGNPIADVTVYTQDGSILWQVITELNKDRPGKEIDLNPSNDPYGRNTVVPASGGDNSGGSPAANPETKGEDGTAIGKGASESLAVKTLQSYSSESDPAGSIFNLVQAKLSKATKSSLKLSWKRPSGAVKFIVLGNKCGKSNKLVLQTTVNGTSYNVKKVSGKKLKKGTYYKFIVIAVDARGKVVSTSKIVHACTKGGKTGNDKKVTTKAKKNKVNLKKGKSFKLGAKPVPVSKALKVKRHRGIKYETSDKSIATVTSKGVIKGKKKGKCYVYAYAQNGVAAKIKVTVK